MSFNRKKQLDFTKYLNFAKNQMQTVIRIGNIIVKELNMYNKGTPSNLKHSKLKAVLISVSREKEKNLKNCSKSLPKLKGKPRKVFKNCACKMSILSKN